VATTSGKCTKEVLKDWYQTIIRPQIVQKSLLLLDAYGGFNTAADDENGDECEDEDGLGNNDFILLNV